MLTGIAVPAVKTCRLSDRGCWPPSPGSSSPRGNAVDPNEGIGAELRVISAVIVGGASLSGGRGTIFGSFLGLLLMQVITTGLIFVDVPPKSQQVAVGLVLILAAIIDRPVTRSGRA